MKKWFIGFVLFWGFWSFLHAVEGEFEDRYQIGNKICVVNPVRMAFEVKCDDDKAAKIFFYESGSDFGSYCYVSEEKARGVDRFVFDDKNLIKGSYLYSDGTQDEIKKIIIQK